MRLVDPCTDPAWSDLADRYGRLFHSPAWLRVVRDGYRLHPRALLGDEGGVAWVDFDDVRGRRSVSLPFSDFGGPIGTDPAAVLEEMSSCRQHEHSATVIRVLEADSPIHQTSNGTAATDELKPVGQLAWHWADLLADDTSSDRLWSALASGARQNVRKAERSGVAVEVRNDVEAMDTYYRLHHGLRKTKYRLLSQPWSFFAAVHQHFGPDDLRVVLARQKCGSKSPAVAGVLLLRHRDWGYYKLNASTGAAWEVRANDAVMWRSMLEARDWECRFFDFGVSDVDQPGLIRYKRKYATGDGRVVVMRRDGDEQSWRAKQADRLLPQVTRALTSDRCPDAIGGQASRVLYRLFG